MFTKKNRSLPAATRRRIQEHLELLDNGKLLSSIFVANTIAKKRGWAQIDQHKDYRPREAAKFYIVKFCRIENIPLPERLTG